MEIEKATRTSQRIKKNGLLLNSEEVARSYNKAYGKVNPNPEVPKKKSSFDPEETKRKNISHLETVFVGLAKRLLETKGTLEGRDTELKDEFLFALSEVKALGLDDVYNNYLRRYGIIQSAYKR